MHNKIFFFGEWQIEPASNSIRQGDTVQTLEPKAMDVLRALCQHPNEVLSAEDLLNQCWPGADIGDNPVHKVMAQLRKALGDEASNPRYIETIRKRGYRAIAPVVFPAGDADAVSEGEWQNASPFPGLRPFTVDEAGVFFGRGDAVTQLLRSMVAQHRAGHALNLVLGPSGSGKTSLVNAGIIPNLLSEHGFDGVRVLSVAMLDMADVTPERVFLDLASALLDWEISDAPVFAGISADSLARELQHQPEKLMALFANTMAEAAAKQQLQLLLIDRLEVLLSANHISDEARATFLHALDALARSGAALVIATCRNDFYPLIAQHRALMHGKASGAHFDVQPPTRAEMLQMIRLPAKAAGLQWQSDQIDSLDHMLCDDAAGNPDALPMLQYTLHELYQQHGDDKLLKIADYHALGGIEGAIGKRAEALFSEQSEAVKAALPTVLAKLVSLSSDEKSITSRAALWSQLANDDERQLVQALIDHRLLVSHLVGNEPGFSLAHEALLRRWPRVVEWIAQHRYNLKIKSRLALAAERWLSEGQAKEFLIADGKPLLEAKDIQQNQLFALTELEQRYIGQSNKRSNVRKLIKRATVFSLALLTMLSIAMTLRSVESERRAEERRAQADDLLGFMVGEFADKVRPLGRLDLLGGVSGQALNYLSSIENKEIGTSIKHAKALQIFGEVALAKGDKLSAQRSFQLAFDQLKHIREKDQNEISHIKDLGIISYWRGKVHLDQNQFDQAKEHFSSYKLYSEEFLQFNPKETEALLEVSYAYNNLGTLALRQGKYQEAVIAFEKSVHHKQQAALKDPSDLKLQSDLANGYSWLGSALERVGELTKAMDLYDQELLILGKIRNEAPTENKWKWREANALDRKAELLVALGQESLSDELHEKVYSRMQELRKADPSNETWRTHLLYTSLKRVWYKTSAENIRQGLEDIEKVLAELTQQLEKLPDNPNLTRTNSIAKLKKAEFYLINNQYEDALKYATEAFNIMAQLSKTNSVVDRQYLSDAQLFLAYLYRVQEKANLSKIACEKIINELGDLAADSMDHRVLKPWIIAHVCLGRRDRVSDELRALKAAGYNERQFLSYLSFFSKS